MKALSVRQPWADAILWHGKRIENRTWNTRYRGPLLLHAAKRKCGLDELEEVARMAGQFGGNCIPMPDHYGGIVGRATLAHVVTESTNPWFTGPYGFVLEDVTWLEFVPARGRLGLFEVEWSP